jgi:hypothetical protein
MTEERSLTPFRQAAEPRRLRVRRNPQLLARLIQLLALLRRFEGRWTTFHFGETSIGAGVRRIYSQELYARSCSATHRVPSFRRGYP